MRSAIFTKLLLDMMLGDDVKIITAGHVEKKIANALGSLNTGVVLKKERLIHIMERHKDIEAEDLAHLPEAIKKGLVIKEVEITQSSTPSINICYQHPHKETSRYKINIQRIRTGELAIMSFHRTKRRQTIPLMRRGKKLRDHW